MFKTLKLSIDIVRTLDLNYDLLPQQISDLKKTKEFTEQVLSFAEQAFRNAVQYRDWDECLQKQLGKVSISLS